MLKDFAWDIKEGFSEALLVGSLRASFFTALRPDDTHKHPRGGAVKCASFP